MKSTFTFIMILLVLIASSSAIANEGNVSIEAGYIYTDEEGNLGVNQETYNLFDGFNLSIKDFTYLTNSGIRFNADLNNTTLDNRNLSFSTSKPGLFSVSAYSNNYFRSYNKDQTNKTERNNYGFSSSISPIRNVKLFGRFSTVDKAGTVVNSYNSVNVSDFYQTDYSHKTYSFGGQGFCEYGSIRFEYQSSDFDDKLLSGTDRESEQIVISAFSEIPGYRNIHLLGGFANRNDKITSHSLELKTNQLWGGTKYYFRKQSSIEYRIRFARTEHSENLKETDNWINTLTFSNSWKRDGGFRLSYENRIVDDLIDRAVSNGAILSGWYNPASNIFINGKISLRNKDIKTGSTLIGQENVFRHLFSVRYSTKEYGNVTVRLDQRSRENDDINSKVDYTAISAIANLIASKFGSVNITYSNYVGKFENTQDQIGYEFSDHVLTGFLSPSAIGSLDFGVGGNYYRSKREQDVEKFSMNFLVKYSLPHQHQFVLKYDVFNYDDYLLNGNYYTANIVEFKIIKDLSL